jgi:hypothetical protein
VKDRGKQTTHHCREFEIEGCIYKTIEVLRTDRTFIFAAGLSMAERCHQMGRFAMVDGRRMNFTSAAGQFESVGHIPLPLERREQDT